MTDPVVRTIALVSPLWYGHHPVFFRHFSASFLRAGARVLGLVPDPEAAEREIASGLDGPVPDWRQKISLHRLPVGGRSFFNGRFEGDPFHTTQRWNYAGHRMLEAEAETGWEVDLVYFPYLDSYLRFLPVAWVPAVTIGRPWSGLYLRNHHHRSADAPQRGRSTMLAKGDRLLRSPLCREVGVLDERFVEGIEAYLGKPVIPYPDITDATLPDVTPDLTREIVEKAKGRKVIGLIGLEARKGTLTLLKVALEAQRAGKPWFFVFAGVFDREDYRSSDREFMDSVIDQIQRGELDHIHFDPEAGRIPTEADFNALFASFDVAWAAFEGFQGSSGTLSKAGAFRIPCVATAGECIGRRVERYHLGLTLPEGDAAKAMEAIDCLLRGRDWEGEPLEPDYEGFNQAHSFERLDAITRSLVESL